jgi:hypothetical protein
LDRTWSSAQSAFAAPQTKAIERYAAALKVEPKNLLEIRYQLLQRTLCASIVARVRALSEARMIVQHFPRGGASDKVTNRLDFDAFVALVGKSPVIEGWGFSSTGPSVKRHTIRANGIRQYYMEAGEGAPVVLLHGFPETSYAWRHQIPELARKYRVIAPDLRGYGETDKPATGYDKRNMANDLRELMRSLEIPKIALVGQSRKFR